MTLSGLDLAVVVLYLGAVVAHGLWASRGERDAGDYFLAGRALPWWLIGLSLYASNMSGASFVGLIGASYTHGLAVYHYEWTAAAVLIFFACLMAPVFFRNRLFTVPEYLEIRFEPRVRKAFAGFTILAILLIDTAGALYAGGLVVTLVVPSIGLAEAAAVLAVLAGLYTLAGGLRAVVVTDAVQAVLLIAGAAAVVWVGLDRVGGWEALMAAVPREQTVLFRAPDDDFLPWPGIGGVLLLGFYYWTINQYFVQRALGARTVDDARKGALFAGLLKIPNLLLMVVPGLIALVLYPRLESADQAFPTLAFEMLPEGLRGLALTALLAAIMSSLDSALNAAASLLTMDFVRPARPGLSGHRLLRIGQGFTLVLIGVAASYAPLIERAGSLFEYFQATLAYIAPPVVAVVLGGLLVRRLSAGAAFWGLVLGVGGGLVLFVARQVTGAWAAAGLPEIHFTYAALLTFLMTGLLMAVLSALDPPPAGASGAGEGDPGRTGDPPGAPLRGPDAVASAGDLIPDPPPRTPLHDYRWQAAGLALLTALSIWAVA